MGALKATTISTRSGATKPKPVERFIADPFPPHDVGYRIHISHRRPSPPTKWGEKEGTRACAGRERWAAASASEASGSFEAPPHPPIASQWAPPSPPLRGGEG